MLTVTRLTLRMTNVNEEIDGDGNKWMKMGNL